MLSLSTVSICQGRLLGLIKVTELSLYGKNGYVRKICTGYMNFYMLL